MATGYLSLPLGAFTLPDNSSGNDAPVPKLYKSLAASPHRFDRALVFAGTGNARYIYLRFTLPGDYSAGGSLLLNGRGVNTTAGDVVMQAQVAKTTPGDADTPAERAYAAASTVTIGNNTTEAGRLLQGTVSPNMDGAVAGDSVSVRIFRDPAHASDGYASDFELLDDIRFSYTTT